LTKDEMIEQLLMQVNSLTIALNSLQQSFDAQTALVANLNQTIQELKEQLNKNSKNSSKPPSSDGFKKPTPKSLRKSAGKKVGGQDGHQGTHLAVISEPDEIVKHMPPACEGCPHYKMGRGTACIAERRPVIDAVVTV
jgi:transposase